MQVEIDLTFDEDEEDGENEGDMTAAEEEETAQQCQGAAHGPEECEVGTSIPVP